MNTVFLITFAAILVLISPAAYILYRVYKDDKIAHMDDVARIRFIKEMEMIEGMKK